MCGIFALFGYKKASSEHEFRVLFKAGADKIMHRGPDYSGVVTFAERKML